MPEENAESCRCCINPSSNFVKLTTKSKIDGAEEKSYHEVLQEITRRIITSSEERRMPQNICRKCVKHLKNVYSFILQTQNTYDYYRGRLVQEDEETKVFEQLHETLIEIPETTSNLEEGFQLEIKVDCSETAVETKNTDVLIYTPRDLDDGVKEELQDESSMNENNLEGFLDEGVPDDMPNSDSDEDYDIESLDNDDIDDLNGPIACRCDVCHKVYRGKRSLAIHKRFSHMPEDEKMACPLCSYKTSRSSALKVHMGLIHGPKIVEEHFKPNPATEKNFPCNLCERGYQRREDLRKHIRKKHKTTQLDKQQKRKDKPPKQKEELRFLCAFCGQSYTSKKALDGHQLTHTGERPYECDVCHKTFKRSKDIKAHRVIHSDEKPFQCSQCSKSFKRPDKLKMHMRVHSELRPYKCTECEKSFKYPCVLRTHMYMHTGQAPYSCNTCGEAFSLRTSRNNHCLKNGHVQ